MEILVEARENFETLDEIEFEVETITKVSNVVIACSHDRGY